MKTRNLILLFAAALMMVASGCKKEAKPGQIESIRFKQSNYTIAENYLELNLRKELETVPTDVKDTAKIKYTISDESVAEMNGSFLEPKRDGNITVTAAIQGKSATCDVKITPVPIESIELEDFSAAINGTAETKATIKPNGINRDRLTWSIDKPEIATIDSKTGVVTGKSEGTATVTASADGKSGTCKLTVKKKLVTKVTVTPGSGRLYKTGDKLQLSATVEPDDASFPEITWSSEPSGYVSVVNGLVTFIKYYDLNKPVVVTAKADNEKGTCNVMVWPQQATKITLNKTSHTFSKIGDTFELSITNVEPAQRTIEDEYKWQTASGKTEICTVNGSYQTPVIKAKKVTIKCTGVGTETVRCTDWWSGVTAECTITLPKVPVTGISLKTAKDEVTITDGSFTVTAEVTPSNANEDIQWQLLQNYTGYGKANMTLSADKRTATITPTKAGTIQIKAIDKYGNISDMKIIKIFEGVGTVSDRCTTYKTVKIGNQWWMAENVRCNKYGNSSERQGVTLANAKDGEPSDLFTPYYYYNSNSTRISDWSDYNKARIGYLYNWAAATACASGAKAKEQTGEFNNRRQGICPDGWHLPTKAELATLKNYADNASSDINGFQRLKAKSGWQYGTGYDTYGFYALPIGRYYYDSYDDYGLVGTDCHFWSASSSESEKAYNYHISSSNYSSKDYLDTSKDTKKEAYSVRCVKN